MILNQQPISVIDTTLEMTFWESIPRSGRRGKEEGVRILAVLWAIWLHQNGELFNGRVVSTDRVAYVVEGFVAAWSSRPGESGGLLKLSSHLVGLSPLCRVTIPCIFQKNKIKVNGLYLSDKLLRQNCIIDCTKQTCRNFQLLFNVCLNKCFCFVISFRSCCICTVS